MENLAEKLNKEFKANEIKAKVFAPYLGVAWVQYHQPGMEGARAGILTGHDLNRIEHGQEPFAKICLKPLSAITDEDATKVARIGCTHGEWIKDIIKKGRDWSLRGEMIDCLRSLGYDTRNYYLDGKTLHEAGLAVYKIVKDKVNHG